MSRLTDEAITVANELAKIQPDTIVESVIRRLVGEIHFKERYIETYRIGKSQTESGGSGAPNRNPDRQPGEPQAGEDATRTGETS